MTGGTFWARGSPWPAFLQRGSVRRLIAARYQRAFVDYFEDQLVQYGYDWKQLVHDYMFEGKEPLINSMISGRESLRNAPPLHIPSH